MIHNRRRRIPIVAGLLILGLAGILAFAAGTWTIVGYQAAGNTVTAEVHNTASHDVSGTVYAQVVQGGQTYTAMSAVITIPANTTVPVPIIVGTITDDITPFNHITFGTITD